MSVSLHWDVCLLLGMFTSEQSNHLSDKSKATALSCRLGHVAVSQKQHMDFF